MSGRFVRSGDGRWQHALTALPHDVYHLPAYAELAARTEGGVPVAYHDDEGCLIPLLERPVPQALELGETSFDLASPYGYASPLVATGEGAAHAALRRFVDVARERGAVTAFLRLHPLLPWPVDAMKSVGALVEHGPTVVVDLRPPLEEITRGIRSGFRYDIRRLRRSGYVAAVNEWERFDDFVRLYEETMQRVGAADTYCFDRSYYAGLRVALGDRLALVTVAAPGGQTVAAGLVMVCGSIAQYHLSGSDPAHAALAPTKLLLAHAIAHVRERGATRFHLGGGVGGREDSLFAFKAGFSAERARFATLRIVLDPVRYHALCARWSSLAHEAPSAVDDFFPAYRRPIVTGAAPGPSVGARP